MHLQSIISAYYKIESVLKFIPSQPNNKNFEVKMNLGKIFKFKVYRHIQCMFGSKLKSQFILLFSLFLLLFMGPTAFFGIIHGSHCVISTNFYLCLQYFQQKNFSFSKISKSQTDPQCAIFVSCFKMVLIHVVKFSTQFHFSHYILEFVSKISMLLTHTLSLSQQT